MASSMQSTGEDRRLHPRRAVCHPLTVVTDDGTSIPCESVDLSVGGMKIQSTSRIPLGPADVVISADVESTLALRGKVVEELIDAATGVITARIVFDPDPPAAIERVVALPDLAVEGPPSSRRRTFTVLAAAIVAGIVVAGGVYATTRDGDTEVTRTAPAATAAPMTPTESSPIDAPPHVASAASGPVTSASPIAPESRPTPAPAPAPARTAPAAAPAARIERTNDLTRVVVGTTAEETSVRTTTRPSPEGDVVRLQLDVTPEPSGTTLPVAVRLENRSAETLRFPDGLSATVIATRQGATDAVVTLTSGVTSLAPGESATVDGFLDFGATGEYDVSATAEVTSS